jgi:ethanolamine utilization protein EutQ
VSRRVHTADDVLGLARQGRTELVVAPEDLVTPLARDVAAERGVRIATRVPAHEDVGKPPHGPAPVRHVPGANVMALDPFPVDLQRPEMDVRLLDVVKAEHGLPIAAGVMSLRAGSFPWTLDYDEVQYVIEGELHITTAGQQVVGRPGDLIAVPKGSSITFATPTWAKFLYVTYPADWSS